MKHQYMYETVKWSSCCKLEEYEEQKVYLIERYSWQSIVDNILVSNYPGETRQMCCVYVCVQCSCAPSKTDHKFVTNFINFNVTYFLLTCLQFVWPSIIKTHQLYFIFNKPKMAYSRDAFIRYWQET